MILILWGDTICPQMNLQCHSIFQKDRLPNLRFLTKQRMMKQQLGGNKMSIVKK